MHTYINVYYYNIILQTYTILAYINMYMLTKIKCIHAHISTYVCFLNWLLISMLSEFTSIILCLAHSEKLSSHLVYGTNFEWTKERSGTCLCLSMRSYLVIATTQENFLIYRHLLKRLRNVCVVEMQVINPWYYCYRIIPLKGYG